VIQPVPVGLKKVSQTPMRSKIKRIVSIPIANQSIGNQEISPVRGLIVLNLIEIVIAMEFSKKTRFKRVF